MRESRLQMWREVRAAALVSAPLVRGHLSLRPLSPLSPVPGPGVSMRQEQLQTKMHGGHAHVWGHVWQAARVWGSQLCRKMSQARMDYGCDVVIFIFCFYRGSCPSCLQMRVKSCRCGAKKKEMQCGRNFTCDIKCKKLRDCFRHPCNK